MNMIAEHSPITAPTWATQQRVSTCGVIDWTTDVALLAGAEVFGKDVTVVLRQSSPNDVDDPAPGPKVSIECGIEAVDLRPADARRLASELVRAADIADGVDG